MKKRFLSALLAFTVLISLSPPIRAADELSRGQFIALLINRWFPDCTCLHSEIVFSDISDSDTYSEIMTAWQLGIAKGDGNGCFYPENLLTRQDAAVFLVRALCVLGACCEPAGGNLSVFFDGSEVSPYAAASLSLLCRLQIFESFYGLAAPLKSLSTEDIDEIFKRAEQCDNFSICSFSSDVLNSLALTKHTGELLHDNLLCVAAAMYEQNIFLLDSAPSLTLTSAAVYCSTALHSGGASLLIFSKDFCRKIYSSLFYYGSFTDLDPSAVDEQIECHGKLIYFYPPETFDNYTIKIDQLRQNLDASCLIALSLYKDGCYCSSATVLLKKSDASNCGYSVALFEFSAG